MPWASRRTGTEGSGPSRGTRRKRLPGSPTAPRSTSSRGKPGTRARKRSPSSGPRSAGSSPRPKPPCSRGSEARAKERLPGGCSLPGRHGPRERNLPMAETNRNPTVPATPRWFALGKLVATPGALADFTMEEIAGCLERHAANDWGDMDPEDLAANDAALEDCSRVFSSYRFPDGRKLWVITEASREHTTTLRPEDY